MAAWRTPSTSREVASDGSPAPHAPLRSRLWLLVAAGTMAGLAAGLVVGAITGIPGRAEDKPLSRVPVTAGVVTEVLGSSADGWDFELPVFNASASPVDASLVTFGGANWTVTSDRAEDIAAWTWGKIPFSVAANCDVLAPGPMTSVRLRVQTREGASVADIALPGRGSALRDYHRAVCASAEPVTASKLVGVWIVEKVYGPDTWLVGTHLMRFDRDGSFAADREGGLYSDDVGVRGKYRLEGELLTIDVTGGHGCVAPVVATWRVTVRSDQMSMVWVRGVCPSGEPGDAWVVRRVLDPGRVPGSPN